MTEPISSGAVAAGFAASLGGITLSLLGVPYHAVIWGFVGAMATLSKMEPMPKRKAFVYGMLSTLSGAALGSFGVELTQLTSRAALIVGSLVGGAGAFALIGALVSRATALAGGGKPADAPNAPDAGGKP
jgi:hypothetical protein